MGVEFKRCFGCMREKPDELKVCPHCGYEQGTWSRKDSELEPGTILNGQYLVGKMLGKGGFGITYMGWDLNLDICVAIKEYFPSLAVERAEGMTVRTKQSGNAKKQFMSGKERFMKEARALARFSDIREIVEVKNFFEENNTAYIIMEYLDGCTLKQYVGNMGGRLGQRELAEQAEPIMNAISSLHHAGIIHRDISPDNIMVLKNGSWKLLDFGNAKVLDQEDSSGEVKATEVILKEGFAPLEQYQTLGNLGPWTDVYSFCASLYYCLTGIVPPRAPDRVHKDILKPLSQIDPGINRSLEQIIIKGMSMEPEQRYPNMGSVGQAMKAIPWEKDPSPIPVPPPDPIDKKASLMEKIKKWDTKLKAVVGLAALAALLIMVGLMVSLMPGNRKAALPETGTHTEGESSGNRKKAEQAKEEEEEAEEESPAKSPMYNPDVEPGKYIEDDFVFYVYETGGAELSYYRGSEAQVNIPETYEGIPVIAVGSSAFSGKQTIRQVTIPDTVEVIGSFAFYNCENLKSIILPEKIQSIRGFAFCRCSKMNQIVIPAGTAIMGEWAFGGCENLTIECEIAEKPLFWRDSWNKQVYETKWGEIPLKDEWQEDGFIWREHANGDYELLGYEGGKSRIDIPDAVEGHKVTSIGLNAFEQLSGLEELDMPDSVIELKDGVFEYNTMLDSIHLSDKVTVIPERCFLCCQGLTNVTIPSGIEKILSAAFFGCENMEQVNAGDTVESIGTNAFAGCKNLYSVILPGNVAEVEKGIVDTSDKAMIFCEAKEQPKGWASGWVSDSHAVFWDVSEDEVPDLLEAGVDGASMVGIWESDENGWCYKNGDSYLVGGWHQIFWRGETLWYHFDKKGYTDTGWYKEKGFWYYLGKDRGGMNTGLTEVDGNTYFLDVENGKMTTGWVQLDEKWYYFDKQSGFMLKDTTTPDGYQVGADGAMID